MKLAERMNLISESITLKVSAKANALKKAGVDVVGFGAGEPDFDTPAFIKEAAKAALDGVKRWEPNWDDVAVSLSADIARWHKVTDSE